MDPVGRKLSSYASRRPTSISTTKPEASSGPAQQAQQTAQALGADTGKPSVDVPAQALASAVDLGHLKPVRSRASSVVLSAPPTPPGPPKLEMPGAMVEMASLPVRLDDLPGPDHADLARRAAAQVDGKHAGAVKDKAKAPRGAGARTNAKNKPITRADVLKKHITKTAQLIGEKAGEKAKAVKEAQQKRAVEMKKAMWDFLTCGGETFEALDRIRAKSINKDAAYPEWRAGLYKGLGILQNVAVYVGGAIAVASVATGTVFAAPYILGIVAVGVTILALVKVAVKIQVILETKRLLDESSKEAGSNTEEDINLGPQLLKDVPDLAALLTQSAALVLGAAMPILGAAVALITSPMVLANTYFKNTAKTDEAEELATEELEDLVAWKEKLEDQLHQINIAPFSLPLRVPETAPAESKYGA